MDTSWQEAAQRYLERLAGAEYREGLERHIREGRKRSTYRHNPSQYHRDLVMLLGKDDEEGFKALKGLTGYASSLGV